MHNLFHARTRCEIETHRRIILSVAALAYEYADPDNGIESFISDHVFDRLSLCVDLSVNTKRPDLDEWFRREFDPCTGSWIRTHPDKNGLLRLYHRHYKGKHLDHLYKEFFL